MGRKEEGRWEGEVMKGEVSRYVNGYTNCLGNGLWITTNLQMVDTIETHGESLNTNMKLCYYITVDIAIDSSQTDVILRSFRFIREPILCRNGQKY